MTLDLARVERGEPTAVAVLQSRMDTILDVMANVLETGKDYGKIPGTDKPTLFKPGAEKLCLTFSLAASDPLVEDLSTDDEIRYRLRVPITASDGRVLAVGIGEASTGEEKYRWRRPVCDEEFAETPRELRREKWFRGRDGKGNWKATQVRTVPTDLANTVLKMAHKRAFIHATLLATGASSVFNQDLEDFTKELAESVIEGSVEHQAAPSARSTITPPARKSSGNAASSLTAVGVLTKCARSGPQWVVTLQNDKREFTTRDDALGQTAAQLQGKPVRVTFTEKVGERKTFYNVTAIAAVEPPAEAPPTRAPHDLHADDIFGGAGREPGEEG